MTDTVLNVSASPNLRGPAGPERCGDQIEARPGLWPDRSNGASKTLFQRANRLGVPPDSGGFVLAGKPQPTAVYEVAKPGARTLEHPPFRGNDRAGKCDG
jgi:hypothetical protein